MCPQKITPMPLTSRISPALSKQSPFKNWDPVNPPFFENSNPPKHKGAGAHYRWNFSNRSHLGTIKQNLNDSFINRVNQPRITEHHLKIKTNNLNWRNKTSGKCHKNNYWKKNSTTINTTVQQYTKEQKREFWVVIRTALSKIQSNKGETKNAKKNIEETWNDKL